MRVAIFCPIRKILLVLTSLLCFGCTTTSIDVYQNLQTPQASEKYLIFAATPLMPVEKVVEDRFIDVFKKNNIDAVAKYKLILGIQNLDEPQFNAVIEQNKITKILILRPVGETQNSPETSMLMPKTVFGLYNREATYLYESSDTWSRRNRQIYAQVIDVKEQKIVWYAMVTTKSWTTTEIDLYKNNLGASASDMAVSIVNSLNTK